MCCSIVNIVRDAGCWPTCHPAVSRPQFRRSFAVCKTITSILERAKHNFKACQLPAKSLKAVTFTSRHTRLEASKKDPGSPDREELLKAGLELAKNVAAADPKFQAISAFAGKYLGTDAASGSNTQTSGVFSAPTRSAPHQRFALLALLLLNIATFVLANDITPQFFASLPLNHAKPCWWQFLTSCFCSTSWMQLSAVAFMAVAYGTRVLTQRGAAGLWLAYTLGAVGTNLLWYWLLPDRVGRLVLLTSSSVYGGLALFLTSAFLQRGSFWWWLLEVVLLGQFLLWVLLGQPAISALPSLALGGGAKVAGSVVGLAGCAAGVGLYFGLHYCFGRFAKWAKQHSK